MKPEAKLLHMLEIQRRLRADDGNCYVGGNAVLTTVTCAGVTQRVVHRWPDKVGKPVKPERDINWKALRRELRGRRKRWR